MSNEKVQLLFKLTDGKMLLAGIFPETHFTDTDDVPTNGMVILAPVGVEFNSGVRRLIDMRTNHMTGPYASLPDFSYIPEELYKEKT